MLLKIELFMKIQILFFFTFCVTSACSNNDESNSTNIYVGDIILLNQEDLNDFAKKEYTEITGNARIGEFDNDSPINDLSPFYGLEIIGGDLIIFNNVNLKNLAGLESLSFIGGGFDLCGNNELINIDELKKLSSVAEFFRICSNDKLNSIDGLSNLNWVGTYFIIDDNISLKQLAGLNNLSGVGLDLGISGNQLLSDFCSLEKLIVSNGLIGSFWAKDNAYNPSVEDIKKGACVE